jgi:hypothetical protein
MNKRGDIVVIYSSALKQSTELGQAKLFELIKETDLTERWLIQFIGEAKLEQRTIKKVFPPGTETKLAKQTGGTIIEVPVNNIDQEPEKMEKITVNGVLKYRYKQMREDQARRSRDPFKEYLNQINKNQ